MIHSSLPGSVTPQSLGITQKQPIRPVREKTAPPCPGHSHLAPPTITHREEQTTPGTVDTLDENTNTLTQAQTHTDTHPYAKCKHKHLHTQK